jgi:hypothetical protein
MPNNKECKHEMLSDSTKDIDNIINDFLLKNGAELIDIKITPIECSNHNNGGYNTIDLIYTVIYKSVEV